MALDLRFSHDSYKYMPEPADGMVIISLLWNWLWPEDIKTFELHFPSTKYLQISSI